MALTKGRGARQEFMVMAVPAMLVLVSILEIARGMWCYRTLTHALNESARFAISKSENCSGSLTVCRATISDLAVRVGNASGGLVPSSLNLSFISPAGAIDCQMDSCLTNTTFWPLIGANVAGNTIEISGRYPFHSAIAKLWVGAGPATIIGKVNLPSSVVEAAGTGRRAVTRH